MGQNEQISELSSWYVRIIAPGILTYVWGACIANYSSSCGKPRYEALMTIIPSIIHWVLAYILAVNYDMKIIGVAISSSVHFFFRFLVILICVRCDSELNKGLISLFHEDSWKSLGHITKVGWNAFLLGVMGWWAFDVFT